MGLPRERRGRRERNYDHRPSIAVPRPPVVAMTSVVMPVPSVVAGTPVVAMTPVVAAVTSIVTPVTTVVTPPVVDAVVFLVATPAVGATTPRVGALQRGQDRNGDDGSQYPLHVHDFHRFTPARRTGRHDSRSRTGGLPVKVKPANAIHRPARRMIRGVT
ncbi:MAG: hypothetical protein F9K25_19560 [Candidatus Contendobacter sp.]|nr:MAG: hypothetical protein F9K25_19560 [Candidatus Contendobacter sp.]